MKKKNYPAERETFSDPTTGNPVIRWTGGGTINGLCYVSHNCFCDGGEGIVFASDRGGSWDYYRLSRRSGIIEQLTDNRDPILASHTRNGPFKYYDVCLATNQLVYLSGGEVRLLSLDDFSEQRLMTLPEQVIPDYPSINADGTKVAMGYIEDKSTCVPGPGQKAGRLDAVLEFRYRHPASTIVVADVKTGKVTGVWGECEYLDHIQIHPTEDLIFFCREGWPAHRAHWVPIDHSFVKEPRLILPAQKPGIELTGHEVICRSGELLFMLIERLDHLAPTEKKRIESEFDYYAFIRTDGARLDRRRPLFRGASHVTALSSEHPILGNAAFRYENDPDGARMIGRFERMNKGGVDLSVVPLCRHDFDTDHFAGEPHPILSPDGRSVIFSTAHGRRGRVDLYETSVFP